MNFKNDWGLPSEDPSQNLSNYNMLSSENQVIEHSSDTIKNTGNIHYNSLTHFYELAIKPRLNAEEIFDHPSHQFKARGSNQLDGGCPWHESKSKTAFTVDTATMKWYCRGCAVGGGALQYHNKLKNYKGGSPDGLDEIEIVKKLAEKAGVTIPEYLVSPEQIELTRKVRARQDILADFIDYTEKTLWSELGEDALSYLRGDRLWHEKERRGRGLIDEEIKKFNIGFLFSTRQLNDYLISRGHQPDDIKQSGVTWFKLEGYILIPWYDEQGRPLTIYARWTHEIPPEGRSKTIALPNPKDEEGQAWEHTKRSPLYLDRAINAGHETVVLVEGVFDALLLQARGGTRVIGCVAAQLSGEQVETLKKSDIKEVIICLDPDSAGEKGVMSCIKSLSAAGIMSKAAPKLPEGLDPDEFCIKYGIEVWYAHINKALPGFQHAAEFIISEHGENIAVLNESALSFASEIPIFFDKYLQDHFWPFIETAVGESHEILMERLQVIRDGSQQKKATDERAEARIKRDQLLEQGFTATDNILNAENPRDAIKDALNNPKTLEVIGVVYDSHSEKIDAWEMDLKDARVPVKDIDRLIRAIKTASKKKPATIIQMCAPTGQQSIRTAGSMITDCPMTEIIIPYPYNLEADKTTILNDDDPDAPPTVIAHAPIIIKGTLENIDDQTQYLQVSYKSNMKWKNVILDRGVALEGRKLVDEASRGFPIAGDNKNKVAKYLHHLEAANITQLPKARITHHLGWQGENGKDGFLWGHELLTTTGETVTEKIEDLPVKNWRKDMLSFKGKDVGDEQIAKGFRSQGTFDDWQKTISRLEPFSKIHTILYAALVPTLLHILDAPNFVVDLANKTSTGKTTVLRAAASIWGEPEEKLGGIMGSWDTTLVYIERACSIQSSLPVILDDTMRAQKKESVTQVIYSVSQGRGRSRGNITSIAKTETFRTVLLSSGEAPATSFTQDGGARTRCLELRGAPFGEASPENSSMVTQLNIDLMKNFGHAGPKFVRYLLEKQKSWPDIKKSYRKGVEHYANIAETAEGGRLSQYFAAIVLAGKIAHAIKLFPWELNNEYLLEVWNEICFEASDAAGDERALRDVVSWSHSHKPTFIIDNVHQEHPPHTCSGLWVTDPKQGYIAFYPTTLKTVLTDFGYSTEAILSSWRDRRWLDVPEGEKRYTKKVQIKIGGENYHPRMNVIKNSAIAESEK